MQNNISNTPPKQEDCLELKFAKEQISTNRLDYALDLWEMSELMLINQEGASEEWFNDYRLKMMNIRAVIRHI